VDRAGDEIFASPTLAGDQHGQVVPLKPLDLIHDALHRRAGTHESRNQRFELALDGALRGFQGSIAGGTQLEALAQDGT
jgi:hypothetical protein